MRCKYNDMVMCNRTDCDKCSVGMTVRIYEKRLEEFKALGLTAEQLREVDRLYTKKCEEVAELQNKYAATVRLLDFILLHSEQIVFALSNTANKMLGDMFDMYFKMRKTEIDEADTLYEAGEQS